MKYSTDIHNYDRSLKRTIAKVRESSIDEISKSDLLRFHDYLFAHGLSKSRVLKYLTHLRKVAELLNKPFIDATKDDILVLVQKIETRPDYSDYTKRDYKIVIKRFYKWLRRSDEYPEEVRWIKKNSSKIDRLLPEELLTKEEIKRMVQVADNPRDKALVFVLYESGCRIGELLSLKIKNVQFDEYGAVLLVKGKTGGRRVRIIASSPLLASWLNIHPYRDIPDAPLWVTLGTRKGKSMLNYRAANDKLKHIAMNAGIRKRVYPHIFRHSRATHLANVLTEAQMKQYFGWVQSSDMASTYVHLSGRDVDKTLLRLNGIDVPVEKREETLRVVTCPRCKIRNSPDAKFCSNCGLCLDVKTAIKIDEARTKADRLMTLLVKRPEVLDTLLKALNEIG